jgi:hypothetical protein
VPLFKCRTIPCSTVERLLVVLRFRYKCVPCRRSLLALRTSLDASGLCNRKCTPPRGVLLLSQNVHPLSVIQGVGWLHICGAVDSCDVGTVRGWNLLFFFYSLNCPSWHAIATAGLCSCVDSAGNEKCSQRSGIPCENKQQKRDCQSIKS